VNCVGEQRNAAGNEHDKKLQRGGDDKSDERPFDGPNFSIAHRSRSVDNAVGVVESMRVSTSTSMVVRMMMANHL
jgi:hypothetical protein